MSKAHPTVNPKHHAENEQEEFPVYRVRYQVKCNSGEDALFIGCRMVEADLDTQTKRIRIEDMNAQTTGLQEFLVGMRVSAPVLPFDFGKAQSVEVVRSIEETFNE